MDISVVLPVFNERGHVIQEIERIKQTLSLSSYSFEIIVVDDGSTDGTYEELQAVKGVTLLRLEHNRGTGVARRTGTRAASGDVVVWTDADMTYPNDRIPELVKELDGFDQVVGARVSEKGTLRPLRRFAKWVIRRLAVYLMQSPIPDLNSGFRAFRRDVGSQFLHLLPSGFSCVSTMTLSFLSNGYSVKHIPIEYAARAGRSKFRPWADTKLYLTQVVRMVLSYEPLRIFLPIGLFLILLGSGKLVFDIFDKGFRIATNTLVVLFAAFQVLIIGLLADLVVRVTKPKNEVESATR